MINTGNAGIAGSYDQVSGTANFNNAVTINGSFNQSGGVANFAANALFSDSMVHSGGVSNFNGFADFPGVVAVGGNGDLGNLVITGTYTQGASSSIVVDVLNNGVNTISDRLTVNGATQLNGGTLLIGFVTNSLGLVTDDFKPFNFSGGASGSFTRVFDVGGNILFINFTDGVFTILGVSPDVPDTVVDDMIRFLDASDDLNETIASNLSKAESVTEELLEESEQGSLVCN